MMQPQPQGYPAPPRFPTGNQPMAGAGQARPSAAPASLPSAAPRPTVRLQSEDEVAPPVAPAPSPLVMPSPEQLGIGGGTAPETPVDWTAVHRRLDALGATCFHMEKTAAGGCKVTCLIPTRQPGRQQHLEGHAATKAEAVRLVLEKAEEATRRN